MTVKELKKMLKEYDDNAEVFLIKDWDQLEDGVLTDRYALTDTCSQIVVVDEGMDFVDYQQVLLVVEEERW